MSKKHPNRWRKLLTRLSIAFLILLFISGCGQTDELSEFEGIVVAKREPADLLVVPNVAATAVQAMTEAELLAMAVAQEGVYFSVDAQMFTDMAIGSKVIVYYDERDGEEVSKPPRIHSRSVEIVTE